MEILEKGFEAQAQSMREFGYTGVTASEIRAAHEKWMREEDMSDIVEMFSQKAFEDHPDIFGIRD